MMKEIEASAKNPLNSSGGESSQQEIMRHLSEEITTGIINLNRNHVKRSDIKHDLDAIAGRSFREKSPEAAVNILLFRKYAEIANDWKDNKIAESREPSAFGELPSFARENKDVELAGKKSFGSKIFWLRSAVVILSFLSYIFMTFMKKGVTNFHVQYFEPLQGYSDMSECSYHNLTGRFGIQPFHAVLFMAMFTCCYNAVLVVYYMLPVDENKQKYVPYVNDVWTHNKGHLKSMFGGVFLCAEYYKCGVPASVPYLNMFPYTVGFGTLFDFLLLAMNVVCCVFGSIQLEKSSLFKYRIITGHDARYGYSFMNMETYFTMQSYYDTMSRTTPSCIDSSNDPTPHIRTSLGLMYVALFALTLCFIISFSAFRKEQKERSTVNDHSTNLELTPLRSEQSVDEEVQEDGQEAV